MRNLDCSSKPANAITRAFPRECGRSIGVVCVSRKTSYATSEETPPPSRNKYSLNISRQVIALRLSLYSERPTTTETYNDQVKASDASSGRQRQAADPRDRRRPPDRGRRSPLQPGLATDRQASLVGACPVA